MGCGRTPDHILWPRVTRWRLIVHPIELRRDKLEEVFSIGTGESQRDNLDVIVEGDLCSGDRASRAGHHLDLQGSVVQDVRNQCGTS